MRVSDLEECQGVCIVRSRIPVANAVHIHLNQRRSDLFIARLVELASMDCSVHAEGGFGVAHARNVLLVRVVDLVSRKVQAHDATHLFGAHPACQHGRVHAPLRSLAPHGDENLVCDNTVPGGACCQSLLNRGHHRLFTDAGVCQRAVTQPHRVVPHLRVLHSRANLRCEKVLSRLSNRPHVASDNVVDHVEPLPDRKALNVRPQDLLCARHTDTWNLEAPGHAQRVQVWHVDSTVQMNVQLHAPRSVGNRDVTRRSDDKGSGNATQCQHTAEPPWS
mmetsp:Transcript_34802/g.92939  ORF Transcript_34802/g.92939 Transcript_34802/m.92939 type:complete len:277 (-) Transcript_34802:12-842(-)